MKQTCVRCGQTWDYHEHFDYCIPCDSLLYKRRLWRERIILVLMCGVALALSLWALQRHL
jgi:hypothetical protein